ncbi:MAG: hypothetical protein ACRYGG_19970 [Janthinobacterium lividum]
MAKRKKAAVSEDSFRAMIRKIHMTGNLRNGMATLRSNLTLQQIPVLISGIFATPVYRHLLEAHLFPSDITKLKIRLPSHSAKIENAFHWLAHICSKFTEEINAFVSFRDAFYALYLAGEYDDAESIIDQLEEQFGICLWSIDSRICLIQSRDGLAAQRSYLEKVVETPGVDRVTAYLAYWYSFRVDPSLSRSSIESELTGLRQSFGEQSIASSFFCFALDPNGTSTIEHPHYVIHGADETPIFDRYLSLARKVLLLYIRDPRAHSVILQPVLKLLQQINDPVLRKIKSTVLDGYIPYDEADSRITRVFDEYTVGNRAVTETLSIDDLISHPAESPCLELFGRASTESRDLNPTFKPDSLLAQFVRAAADLTTFGEFSDTAADRLQRMAISCPLSTWAMQVAGLAEGTHRFNREFEHSEIDLMWAMASSSGNPWNLGALRHLAPEAANELISRIEPQSSSFRLRAMLSESDFDHAAQEIRKIGMPKHRSAIYLGHVAMNAGNLSDASALYKFASSSPNPMTALAGRAYH